MVPRKPPRWARIAGRTADRVGVQQITAKEATPVVASIVVVVCAWAMVRDTHPVLLGWANLGFHELGHLVGYITSPPEWIVASMGCAFEIGVPLGAAAFLWFLRRDRWGAGACLAWAATAFRSAAVYVADAPYERLQLIGGEHDWAFVLGTHFNRLDLADDLARLLRIGGWLSLAVGVVVTIGVAAWRAALRVPGWVAEGSR